MFLNNNKFIISLGGSLIAPNNKVDWKYLKRFYQLIVEQTKQSKKFYIITGGGSICREYQQAVGKITNLSDNEIDWLGIYVTHLNAELLKIIFRKIADKRIIKNPTEHFNSSKKVIIAGGWKPGWSTDYIAVILAKQYRINTIINLSNIDYVYNKDPNKCKDAKRIKRINWIEFRKIVGNEHKPGINMPFDPIASKKAEGLGLKVIIMNGSKIKNLENYLNHQKVKGTLVE